MSKKGRLKYVGQLASGISLYLYGTYKQISLDRSHSYVFADKDRLDDKAIAYYRKFRSMGVVLELLEEPISKVVESKVEDEVQVPLQNVESVEEEPKEIDLYEVMTSKSEDEVYAIFNSLGFKSRKKSLSSKITECINSHKDALLELVGEV